MERLTCVSWPPRRYRLQLKLVQLLSCYYKSLCVARVLFCSVTTLTQARQEQEAWVTSLIYGYNFEKLHESCILSLTTAIHPNFVGSRPSFQLASAGYFQVTYVGRTQDSLYALILKVSLLYNIYIYTHYCITMMHKTNDIVMYLVSLHKHWDLIQQP